MFSRSRVQGLLAAAAAGAMLGLAPAGASAQSERESLEALRQTTLALIEALVQSGTLSREKADALLADAKRRADAASPWGSVRVTSQGQG